MCIQDIFIASLIIIVLVIYAEIIVKVYNIIFSHIRL